MSVSKFETLMETLAGVDRDAFMLAEGMEAYRTMAGQLDTPDALVWPEVAHRWIGAVSVRVGHDLAPYVGAICDADPAETVRLAPNKYARRFCGCIRMIDKIVTEAEGRGKLGSYSDPMEDACYDVDPTDADFDLPPMEYR